MRIVFCGSGPFAVPTLQALAERHDVAAVITTTTTTPPPPTTTSIPPDSGSSSGQVITGSACGDVDGDATLVGTVNLTCDLVVHGGVLTARSGVTVNGNGHAIDFMHGGRADWQGTPTSTWWASGASFNLERDININGVKRIMFHMGAGPSTIRFVRVHASGNPVLGDYPLHWHLNYDSTRGTLVEGVVVSNSRNRAFVPHGSHGITFRDTIAYDIVGQAYWWDQPGFQSLDTANNSNDILYDRALAHTITNAFDDDRGYRLSAFELGAGLRNTVKDSVARTIRPSHVGDCSGFGWPEINHGFGVARKWAFDNNAAFDSACHGIFVWQNNNETDHIVDGFRGDGISHGAYNSRFRYRNIDVDHVIIHAQGWSVTGGSIGQVIAERHIFSGTVWFADVTIEKFIIRNATNSGQEPMTYRFDRTDMTCSKVTYERVVPGTKVVIDGADC